MIESNTRIKERQWLAIGLQTGQIRTDVGVEIMKLLDRVPTAMNDVPVYPTQQTVLFDGAHAATDA